MYKKVNYNGITQTVPLDPTTVELQSIGMRIRKAVADGYSTPKSNGYSTDFQQQYIQQQQQQHQQSSAPQRVPLPSHISQPPGLSYGSSSTLDGESFDLRFLLLTQQPQQNFANKKRQRDDDDGLAEHNPQINNKDVPVEYFEHKYGSLSFNEEF